MTKSDKPVDYERIGRDFEEIIIKNYFELYRTRHQIWLSFIKGVFGGLGGVIGATVMVGVLIFLLHRLGGLPVVGRYINNVSQTIENKQK